MTDTPPSPNTPRVFAFRYDPETDTLTTGNAVCDLPTAHKAIMGWCAEHGLDPQLMPATNTIRRDAKRRRIHYIALAVDAAGDPITEPDVVTRHVTLQLERDPAPFPPEVTGARP